MRFFTLLKDMYLKSPWVKILFLGIFIFIIIIPFLVFGENEGTGYRSFANGFRLITYHYVPNSESTRMIWLKNNTGTIGSSNDYFIPTNTKGEMDYLFNAMSRLNLAILSLDLDGHCDATEDCHTSPEDCGICAVPSGSYCGNFICENDETSFNCPEDCPGCCVTSFNLPSGLNCDNWGYFSNKPYLV
jgi:hypothetical protein